MSKFSDNIMKKNRGDKNSKKTKDDKEIKNNGDYKNETQGKSYKYIPGKKYNDSGYNSNQNTNNNGSEKKAEDYGNGGEKKYNNKMPKNNSGKKIFNGKEKEQKKQGNYSNTVNVNKTFTFSGATQSNGNKPTYTYNPNVPKCSICNKPVYDKSSTFQTQKEEGTEIVCFDCAKKEIEKRFDIPSKNKIIYLGAGTFGEIRPLKSEKNFIILRRFQYCSPKYEKFTSTYLPEDKIKKMDDDE